MIQQLSECKLCICDVLYVRDTGTNVGFQACMMAPVTVLAHQHIRNLDIFISKLPEKLRPRAAILTGSTRASERKKILTGLESGEIDLLIGTHSLYNQDVVWKNLGFVSIDEQHRWAEAGNISSPILLVHLKWIRKYVSLKAYGL